MERIDEAELRGRLAALETFLGVVLHRVAKLAPEPAVWLRDVMMNVEDNLRGARAEASAEDRLSADFALESFGQLSDALFSANFERAEKPGQPKTE